MTGLLAQPCSPCQALTGVADFEAFPVVGMIRGPTEIDFVPAAGNSQRGRVVPTERQEQWAVARGTWKEGGACNSQGWHTESITMGPMCQSAFLQEETGVLWNSTV